MNYEQLLAQLRAGGTLTLDQLRFLAGELQTRAVAMPAQITEQTPQADADRLEREHQAMLADAERVRGLIVEGERAAQTPPARQSGDPQAAIVAERARISAIRRLGRDFNRSEEFVERHIEEGSDEMAVRSAILDDMRANSERNPVFSHAQVTRDETETRREGMAAAIVARLARAGGQRGVEVPAIGREWAERELVEIAAECIGWQKPLRTPRQVDEMFARAFLTTSDFPLILTNALNVRLLARYQAAMPTYRLWAARYTAPDFRDVNVIRAGDFPELLPINEAGEIKSGTFGESKETFRVSPYGRMLRISRQVIVNDQLGAIEQVLGSTGERIADWENVKAYEMLLSNGARGPTLVTDSKAVFHADHNNLDEDGADISVAAIGAARAAMMMQTSIDGLKIAIRPSVLVTGPDMLTTAEQLLTAITPAVVTNTVPVSMRSLQVQGDPNIPGDAWYLFADPASAPAFIYGYLEGFEGPRLTSEDEFDYQGMKVKLEHDFGVGAIDYRGAYRNDGASGSP